MWKSRGKIYKTSNPNLIITQVRNFPNINDTLESNINYYGTAKLQNDEVYRDIRAYLELRYGGCDFIVYALQDKVCKLAKLPPKDKGWFWCLGYVSPCLEGAANALNQSSRQINSPSFKTYYTWLEHIRKIDGDEITYYVKKLQADALRTYLNENIPENVNPRRKFQLLYNNSIRYEFTSITESLQHLNTLKQRNWYEIIINDFI